MVMWSLCGPNPHCMLHLYWRQRFIGRVRGLARACAEGYLAERERLGFPLLHTGAAAAATSEVSHG